IILSMDTFLLHFRLFFSFFHIKARYLTDKTQHKLTNKNDQDNAQNIPHNRPTVFTEHFKLFFKINSNIFHIYPQIFSIRYPFNLTNLVFELFYFFIHTLGVINNNNGKISNLPNNISILERKGVLYYFLMVVLLALCVLGVGVFFKNRHKNYWWRWIYLFGGSYLLFDLLAIVVRF
ncbi:hypothetical protein, partial [Paramuribaculum intestinale]|uniref:hypothetical protein n=1 Tax=Paramuribaculum intestinale TaxID=2094151 RepID=UPI00272A950C